MAEKYNVVFEYTDKVGRGGYEGVRTWTPFESEYASEKWYDKKTKETHRVLAEGVTEEEAIRISSKTPFGCDIRACLEAATNPVTGKVNPDIPEMKMFAVIVARDLAEEQTRE